MLSDLPPTLHERVICSISAAAKYQIPANALLAVAEVEGGKPGQWVRNTNGTHDVGAMQFNTAYLKTLSKHGITTEHVAASGCYAYDLAAWRLRQHIVNDKGEFWSKVSNYHSRTPKYNQIYRTKLVVRAAKWEKWINIKFGNNQPQVVAEKAYESRPARPARVQQVKYVPRSIAIVDHSPPNQ